MKVLYSKFKGLIPMSLLDRLAIQYSVNAKNQVRLPGQTVFLCILNGLLNHPALTQRMLEEQYEKLTGCTCDHSSFGKRLPTIKVDFFRAILDHLHHKLGHSIKKGDEQALKLRIVDATTVTLSAKLLDLGMSVNYANNCRRSHVKSVVELSGEGLPNLLRVCRDRTEFADQVALGDAMKANTKKGDLWIFDKGCFTRKVFFSLHQAKAFFITPHSQQHTSVLETILELDPSTPQAPPEENRPTLVIHKVERVVFPDQPWDRIPGIESMHIIMIHGHRWDMRSQKWVTLVLMTNLPLSQCRTKAGPYSFEEVTELYRRRWEIETFFKLLKQHLSYEHLTSRSQNGIEVMILMSIITALILIWYQGQTGINRGWRSVKFWLADDVRAWTAKSLRTSLRCCS